MCGQDYVDYLQNIYNCIRVNSTLPAYGYGYSAWVKKGQNMGMLIDRNYDYLICDK